MIRFRGNDYDISANDKLNAEGEIFTASNVSDWALSIFIQVEYAAENVDRSKDAAFIQYQ